MSDMRRNLTQRAVHEAREFVVIAVYLFVIFSLLIAYKSMVLAQHHIDFERHGFALFNALALAKVMLLAQDLHLGDQFKDRPLIYPTILKSFAFTVVLACSAIIEEAAMGRLHGKSFHDSIEVGGGTLQGIVTVSLLVFVMLIPFFGFIELRRVFGPDVIVGVFFRPRHLLNLPSSNSH